MDYNINFTEVHLKSSRTTGIPTKSFKLATSITTSSGLPDIICFSIQYLIFKCILKSSTRGFLGSIQ